MRILSLGNCPLDPTLGSGKTRLARAGGLRARGHEVETWDAPQLLRPWARRLGFRLGLAVSARAAIARQDLSRFDLVEFVGAELWWATAWLARKKRRPLIVAFTDGLELLAWERLQEAGLASRGKLERWVPWARLDARSVQAFSSADRFASLCRLDTDFVVRRGLFTSEQAAVISPGIDAEYLGRPWQAERDNTVAFLGSWTDRKGVDHLSAVGRQFLERHSSWRLLILGAAGAATAIRSAFGAALAPRVEIAPKLPVEEIGRRLDRAKLFFLPTEYEGFGLATAEAMGCGCAAVVTATGFGGDLQHGVEAWLCPFGNRAAMFEALDTLARDDARRERLARTGWARVQSLNWPTSVDQLERTYLGWLAGWRR